MNGFRKWLDGKKVGVLNHYRGGLTIENGLVLEGGTALHWAAYCGKYTIVKELMDKGAGLIDFCDIKLSLY